MVRACDVDAAVSLGADAVGFVFYPSSPRALDAPEARALRARLPSFVRAVGLFVNDPPERVARIASEVGLDVLQLHGDESPEHCARAARAAGGLPWWRAVRMRGRSDLLESSAAYAGAECLLLDAFSDGFGGSGRRFDWDWAAPVTDAHGRPVRRVLAGGLDAANVGPASAAAQAWGVDVSSGVEVSRGVKNLAKIRAFVQAAKATAAV